MNQQYPYPDGPGYGSQPDQEPVPTASYDLEPQPGYDPTSSMQVMGTPPQQPGYGPPPPGAMPPSPPPKKSSTGLIVGLGVGVIVLMLLGGAAVWFFLLGGPGGGGPGGADSADGKQNPFPDSYTSTEAPPPDGETWAMSKPESYDKCVDLNLTGVEKVIPFEGNPEGTTTPDGENTGRMVCEATMVGETNDAGYHPTGTFYVDFDAAKDATEAGEEYAKIWDIATGYGDGKKLDIGEEAEVRTKLDNNVRDVAIAYRVGNVTGLARISVNFSTHFKEPDQQMLTNVLTDVIYSGLN
ncbi:hypothetical protein [Stackebrandtia nassauensis]|uniref:Uncharacterized protein n=1 Tax=Stackebrandtia nassauensis (strain DSM 44728 / CIP 108903 / NRRL B-16338 / NBRC 102104 / LLR-40K-21) TaxID=446470 RepID=D3Q8R4_STANL|nr:hypothetical protein [Stackebrandtia nassauensis]ADD44506.1 hypothetical protein Snas_4865 [Stackebrandtia nassauensis DSM 44728]